MECFSAWSCGVVDCFVFWGMVMGIGMRGDEWDWDMDGMVVMGGLISLFGGEFSGGMGCNVWR